MSERGEGRLGRALRLLVGEPGADRGKAAGITQKGDGAEPRAHHHGRAAAIQVRICATASGAALASASPVTISMQAARVSGSAFGCPSEQRGHRLRPEHAERFVRFGEQAHVRERLGRDRRDLFDAQRAGHDQRGLARRKIVIFAAWPARASA